LLFSKIQDVFGKMFSYYKFNNLIYTQNIDVQDCLNNFEQKIEEIKEAIYSNFKN